MTFMLLGIALFCVVPIQAAHAQPESNVSLQTYASGGTPIFGYYVTIWQAGVPLSSCFSTCTFTVENNQVYQLSASNYGDECFAAWQGGGSTSTLYTLDIASDAPTTETVDATYAQCGMGSNGTSQLTVITQDTGGNQLTGYYTALNQSSAVVGTGYTPASFTVDDGQLYSIQVDNFGSCRFDHWLDTGSSAFSRTVSISSNTEYTAVMNCGSGSGSGGGDGSVPLSVTATNAATGHCMTAARSACSRRPTCRHPPRS